LINGRLDDGPTDVRFRPLHRKGKTVGDRSRPQNFLGASQRRTTKP